MSFPGPKRAPPRKGRDVMQEAVDILNVLERVVRKNTRSFQEDFQFDVRKLTKAAQAQDIVDRSFCWMSRPCGTWCLNERAVLIRDSFEYSAWTLYEDEADKIKAFCVVVTGQDHGRPIGNLYPVDYKNHARRVKENALPAENVVLTFSSGDTITLPVEEISNIGQLRNQYGSIEKIHYTVADEHRLEALVLSGRTPPCPKPRRSRKPPQREGR